MATESLSIAEQQPKLRWFQFSLRSLFILTFLVAIACSWLAVTMQNQRKQKAAAEAIEKAGGEVVSEPTWLGKLLRDDSLVRVIYVDLRHTEVTDADLAHLQGLSQLQDLRLSNTKITDAGLVHLQGLSQLQELGLDSTKITDAGLVHFQGLSQLQRLGLDDTKITDAGLVHLQGLSQLQRLGLDDTKITDAGLVHLQGLSQLQLLWLVNTKVTAQGVKKLQQALPKCTIELHAWY
jgi:hypothetical protein